jgi:magnesium chelatase family protein
MDQIQKYRARVSGPLLDRIDMHIEVPALPREQLLKKRASGESSAIVRRRVQSARTRQVQRGQYNAGLDNRQIENYCKLSDSNVALLEAAIERLGLSARAYHRVLKVARTIADLDRSDAIKTGHVSEAIRYRCLDRPLV